MSTDNLIERWQISDRVIHWLLVIGMAIAIPTGLPLFFKSYGTALEIFVIPGRDILHRVGAVLLMMAATIHFYSRIVKLGGSIKSQVIPTTQDARDLLTIGLRWLGLRGEYPKIGFHHPGEKLIYWGTAVFGLLICGVTGLILWFPELSGPFIWLWGLAGANVSNPGLMADFFAWVRLLHDVGFVFISVTIIGHILLAINATNTPALKAMFVHGKVLETWAIEHHPGWKIRPRGREAVREVVQVAVNIGVKTLVLTVLAIRVMLTILVVMLVFVVLFA